MRDGISRGDTTFVHVSFAPCAPSLKFILHTLPSVPAFPSDCSASCEARGAVSTLASCTHSKAFQSLGLWRSFLALSVTWRSSWRYHRTLAAAGDWDPQAACSALARASVPRPHGHRMASCLISWEFNRRLFGACISS